MLAEMKKPPAADIRAVMAYLGSKTSKAKTEAARHNATLPPKPGKKPRGRPRKAK